MKQPNTKLNRYIENLTVSTTNIHKALKEYTDKVNEFIDEFKIIQDTIVKKGFEDAIKKIKYPCKVLSAGEIEKMECFKPYPFSAFTVEPATVFKFNHLVKVEGDLHWQKIVVTIEENGVLKDKREYGTGTFSSKTLKNFIVDYFDTIIFLY